MYQRFLDGCRWWPHAGEAEWKEEWERCRRACASRGWSYWLLVSSRGSLPLTGLVGLCRVFFPKKEIEDRLWLWIAPVRSLTLLRPASTIIPSTSLLFPSIPLTYCSATSCQTITVASSFFFFLHILKLINLVLCPCMFPASLRFASGL